MKHFSFKLGTGRFYFPWWSYFVMLAILIVTSYWFPWFMMTKPLSPIERTAAWENEALMYCVTVAYFSCVFYLLEKIDWVIDRFERKKNASLSRP